MEVKCCQHTTTTTPCSINIVPLNLEIRLSRICPYSDFVKSYNEDISVISSSSATLVSKQIDEKRFHPRSESNTSSRSTTKYMGDPNPFCSTFRTRIITSAITNPLLTNPFRSRFRTHTNLPRPSTPNSTQGNS